MDIEVVARMIKSADKVVKQFVHDFFGESVEYVVEAVAEKKVRDGKMKRDEAELFVKERIGK